MRVLKEFATFEEADAHAQKLAKHENFYNIEVTSEGAVLDCIEKEYKHMEWAKLKEIFKD